MALHHPIRGGISGAFPVSRLVWPLAQLSGTGLYRDLIDVGAVVGAFGALGGAAGFLAATAARTVDRTRVVPVGEWIAYGGGLVGTFGLMIELLDRVGVR